MHATLTEDGQNMVSKAPTLLQDTFGKRFAQLDDWEKSMIIASLQRVAGMMNAEEIDASPVLHVGDPAEQPKTPATS